MKFGIHFSSRQVLYLASLVSLTFIVISAFLIIKVGQLEKEADLHSEDIRVLNTIQNSSFDVFSSMVEGEPPNWSALSKAYDNLADQTFTDNDLELLTDMILEIKVIADRRRKVDVEPLKKKLSDLINYSNELLEEKREVLQGVGKKLDRYWLFTHISLVFACIMSLALTYSSYKSSVSLKLLRDEKGKNATIFNQALNCIIISDQNGRIVEFNKAAEELFGYQKSEAIGKSFEKLYKSKSDLNKIKESFANKGKYIGEVINQRKDGSQFISFLSANQLKDKEGNIMGSIGISRDITKEKEKEQEYENILDNATDIILTTDLKGFCTFINDACRVQLGYQYREMINKSVGEFIYDEDFDMVSAFYKHQFEQKTSETYLEFRVKKKNGDVIWVGQVAKLLPSPINRNQIIGMQGIIRNIDERKRAQNKLKKREASYRELFENTSELIHSMDEKGKILYCNQSWKERLEYNETEVANLNFFKMLNEPQREELNALIKKLHEEQSREERSIDLNLTSKSGKLLKLATVISEAHHNNGSPTLQLFMRDETEEIQAKQSLGKTEENLKILTESIDDLFYLWNKEKDEYEYISRSVNELLGVSGAMFKKASDFEEKFLHPQDLLKYQSARKKLLKGEPFDLDYRVIVKDKVKWINEKIFPIKDSNGKVYLHSGVMRDISQAVSSEETILKQSKEIGQSLSYVKRMQENMLIELNQIKAKLKGLYVFFQPREEISGDFFIAEKMTNRSHEDIILLAVADCTGNGMPVGMLSFLCNSLLKESFLSSEVKSPSDALEFVRQRLISLFKFDESEYVTDGMNISLCLINPEKMELEFAGANQPLFLLRNEQIMEIKGSRQHVGYNHKTEPFKNHKLTLNVGDSVYLFTDGFYSQFGGDEGKKLLKRRMMDFLLTISHLDAKEQKKQLSEFFTEWKGDLDQIDDATVACYQV
jgi:PAS domain S-box-containing protein